MKGFASISLLAIGLSPLAAAENSAEQARQLEAKGDAMAARVLLQRAARDNPDDAAEVTAYAEFLDRYHDPETRATYEKALGLLEGQERTKDRAHVARRLVMLDLIEGERTAAVKHLEVYRAAGGTDLAALAEKPAEPRSAEPSIEIPGPLRSFARMAALSPDLAANDLLPALARNVVTNGYQATSSGEALEPTEYMKLVNRYLVQAHELEKLGGEQKTIRIATCDSAQTADLLRILGYRMRGGCGSDVVLETVNATRAFITIDSGFPLADLEQDLRTNRPFSYEYRATRIPILWGADYWLTPKDKQAGVEFIDAFLSDPAACRLYVAMAKLDPETRESLRKTVAASKLKAFAHVIDFFGAMFEMRGGKAVVPGGARSAAAWGEMAGVPPDQGASFFEHLVSKDDGWMASYFDSLARVNGPVQDYLTEPQRMKRFYGAIRGRVTSPGPARPVFRSNTDMLLLTTRLRLDGDRPHIPGSLDVWKGLFMNHPQRGRYDAKLSRAAPAWKDPDDVLEALFGLCRKSVENEPLKIFMALSDVERERATPLEVATVDRLARDWHSLGAQYTLFSEAPTLKDSTILAFLDTAKILDHGGDTLFRADSAGMLQALAGLWQIFCRQGSIAPADADAALAGIVAPFGKLHNNRELFDSGRAGIELLVKATHPPETGAPQDRVLELLAGSTSDSEAQAQMIQDMVRIFEAQRLISLNNLFEMADNLDAVGHGQKLNAALVNRLATRISEFEPTRASLTTAEKNTLAFGYWTERHLDAERRTNLRAAIQHAGTDPDKLHELRGQLAPLLRDTLVGLDYVHYAPPGAQLLLANPLFVRSHDFLGLQGANLTWRYTEMAGTGWPSSAGGRLMGSLAALPYALAEAEQNFMVPSREQALIWGDLVPQMILTAKIPRWWNVTPAQMHWVELHMRYAETLLAESALDPRLRERVSAELERQAVPARVRKVTDLLAEGDVRGALDNITPAELFVLARTELGRDRESNEFPAPELQRLERQEPDRINYNAISRAFGTPKPTLTNSYQPELLYLRTFPTLMGYSSRIMAESWESTILYWAALADEVHVAPSQLNLLIPEWTQKTVERIFATHLEDWPALLRSLRTVGEDVRLKLRIQMETDQKAAALQ
jgi:hypothetical protein